MTLQRADGSMIAVTISSNQIIIILTSLTLMSVKLHILSNAAMMIVE
jgi:hypothetical protein